MLGGFKDRNELVATWKENIFVWTQHIDSDPPKNALLDDNYFIETCFEILNNFNELHGFLYSILPKGGTRVIPKELLMQSRKDALRALLDLRLREKYGENADPLKDIDILMDALISAL